MKDLRQTFAFLRFCLDKEFPPPQGIETLDWKELYDFGKKQSLLGILFSGIERLPQGLCTDVNLLAKWTVITQKIKQKNELVTATADKVSQYFSENGFRTCILKGQGNALLYPQPLLRSPGDIDIFVVGGEDKVIEFARLHMNGGRACYHHIDVDDIDGIPVEVHYRASFMQNMASNRALQQFFDANMDLCCSNYATQTIKDKTYSFAVPTTQVNLVYQLAHQQMHFIKEGLGLRQVIDYYQLLMKADINDLANKHVELTLKKCGLYAYAGALMYILHELFNLPPVRMIVPINESFGKFLLSEIIASGNFGKLDNRINNWERTTALGRNWMRIKRDLKLLRYLPKEAVSEPVFRLYHYYWRKKHN